MAARDHRHSSYISRDDGPLILDTRYSDGGLLYQMYQLHVTVGLERVKSSLITGLKPKCYWAVKMVNIVCITYKY